MMKLQVTLPTVIQCDPMVPMNLAVNRRETEPVRVKYNGKRIT